MIEHILEIDKNEVLRYLGYQGQSMNESMEELIDQCISETKALMSLRSIYRKFPIELEGEGVRIKDTAILLKGKDIYNHLEDSKECIIMAATLGYAIDRKILYYEKLNMTKAIILNACATAAIEGYCDYIEKTIKEEVEATGEYINWRYSPGYGDFKIDIQRDIIDILQGEKNLGLNLTSHFMLTPRKSVTAIMGVVKNKGRYIEHKCEGCNNSENCDFKRRGCKK